MLICFIKFPSISKANLNQGICYQSCIISFGTVSTSKSPIKSLTLMLMFSQWKVKKFSNLHYLLEFALVNDPQTAIPSLQIKECNMHHTSRKDDDVELTCYWIFSLLLSTFFILSPTMHTDEVRPKRNSRSARENTLGFVILWNV